MGQDDRGDGIEVMGSSGWDRVGGIELTGLDGMGVGVR